MFKITSVFILLSLYTINYIALGAKTLAASPNIERPPPAAGLQENNFLIKQQQDEFNLEKRNVEIKEFEAWKDTVEESQNQPETQNLEGKNCFLITQIQIDGNTVLSNGTLQKFINSKLNRRLCANEIQVLINEVSKLYISKGFITTLAFVKPQNLASGLIVISVVEGRIEEVNFGSGSFRDKTTQFMISGLKKGEVLNIRKIDQITDNLSTLAPIKYKTNLDAGSKSGLTKININGVKGFPVSAYFDYDNLGQESTGKNRYSGSLRFDNMLALAESLNIKYMMAANSPRVENFSKSLTGSASLPFRQFKATYNVSLAKYLTVIEGQNQDFSYSGNSLIQSGSLQAVFFRNNKMKLTLSTGLNLTNSKNYVNEVLSRVQSRILSNGELNLIGNFYTPFGAFFVKTTYVKGLSVLGGLKDSSSAKNTPKAHFDMGKLYILYSNNLKFMKANFQSTLDAQLSNSELYSQNQFNVGGYYSVRGFKESEIYGSSGYILRNDMDFYLSSFISWPVIKNFGFGFFLDYGAANSPLRDTKSMAGWGYKVIFNQGNLRGNFSVGYPILLPEDSKKANLKDRKASLYLTLSFHT